MSSGLLSLKWNNHRSTFFHVLSSIRSKESYCDATLACDGRFYPVHKLVLSTCSEYFEQIFERTQCKHPVIVLKDIKYDDLEALMNYMYVGEVNVLQEKLAGLIKAAECLKIKGLAVPDEDPTNNNKRNPGRVGGESPHAKRRRKEDSFNHEDRERHSVSNRSRLTQRDQLPQIDTHIDNTHIELSSSNNSGKNRIENISQRISEVDSDQKQHDEGGTDEHCANITNEESDGRLSSQKPVPEMSIGDTSVKSEPPDIQEDIVDDSKETLHSNLGYDPLEDTDSVNADPASVASSSNETPYSDSNLLDSTPQSVEDVVAQALPQTSSSFQGNSFSLWEGESSLQNIPGEGFSGENSQGRSMVSTSKSVRTSLSRCSIDDDRKYHACASSSDKNIEPLFKNFKGDLDDKSFSRTNDLLSPQLFSGYVGTEAKKLCPFCGVEFLPTNIKRHIMVHTGEKPFSCKYCSYKCSQKTNLLKHELIHTGEKPFKCPYCDHRSIQSVNLDRHLKIKHGDKIGQMPTET